jgi:hypothetical protein
MIAISGIYGQGGCGAGRVFWFEYGPRGSPLNRWRSIRLRGGDRQTILGKSNDLAPLLEIPLMNEAPNPFSGPSEVRGGNRYWWRYLLAGVVALVGIYLAYALIWINQRHLAFTYYQAHHCGPILFTAGRAPLAIGILGERGFDTISIAQDSDRPWNSSDLSVKAEVQRVYPEAEVIAVPYKQWVAMQKAWGLDEGKRLIGEQHK